MATSIASEDQSLGEAAQIGGTWSRAVGKTGSSVGRHVNIEASGLTDTGLARGNNEDSFLVLDSHESTAFQSRSFGIYLIADGMGGHRGGEVASALAKQTVSTSLLNSLKQGSIIGSPIQVLTDAIECAHHEILSTARHRPDLHGMGTTITVGLRLGLDLYLGHVGDSRAYLIRHGKIRQLTEDHSLVARLVKEGTITSDEATTHTDRGKILRSLGVSEAVTVDTSIRIGEKGRLRLEVGDYLVFCSDGLTTHVIDSEILDIVTRQEDTIQACLRLVDIANSRGGTDNISVIVAKVKASS
jgi:serine/threonine protein phosphatase PrpC